MIFNSDSKLWQTKRYLIVFLAFMGYFNLYTMRGNLSVAIVAMTDKDRIDHDIIFNWESAEKGVILGSFFYGYIFTSFLGGFAAARFGGNIIFGTGILLNSLACLLTPVAAINLGVSGLIAVRVIQGLSQGISYPSCHALFSKWAPVAEKSRMISLAICGCYFGTVIANLLAGWLAEHYGWGSIFYVFGAIGLLWYVVWTLLVRGSPEQDKWITEMEKSYIINNVSANVLEKLNVPWIKLFTSIPVWAIATAHTCFNWGFYTFLTQLPMYLKDALKFELEATGFVSALPYLTLGIGVATVGYLADWIHNQGYLTVTQVRKTYVCTAFVIQSALLVLLAYTFDPVACVAIITVACTVGAFPSSGYLVNAMDIAPKYASMVVGISNTFATIPGIVSPLVSGLIVLNSTFAEWQIVFFISAAIYLVGALAFGFFASGEVQPWALTATKSDKN